MTHDHVLSSSHFPCLAVPFLISSSPSKQNHARNAQWKDPANPLELAELLDRLAGPGKHTENVEPHLSPICQFLLRCDGVLRRKGSSWDRWDIANVQSCSEAGTGQR
jgi:hypothetical protein